MSEKLTYKDILFFLVVVLMVIGCIIGKVQSDKKNTVGASNETQKIVGIHIKGEVASPGYYELEYGNRIKDAVTVSGGFTDNADSNAINLAEKLKDGEEIIIPSSAVEGQKGTLVNLNTADLFTLCSLDGVGETTAAQIINYRAKHGKFKSVSELKNIDGIGNSKYNGLKDKVTVE